MHQPRIERGAHRILPPYGGLMATMDFTTKPLMLQVGRLQPAASLMLRFSLIQSYQYKHTVRGFFFLFLFFLPLPYLAETA